MKQILRICLALVTVAYPFIVYFGLQYFDTYVFVVFLLIIALLRWLNPTAQIGPNWFWVSILIMIAVWILVFEQLEVLKVYPILVNLSFLTVFSWSLSHPPTVVERLARLAEPALPQSAVEYTRKVTVVWCCFFFLNGIAALVTGIWATDEIWVFYNGLVAYILMGLLFSVEYAVRLIIRGKNG